MFKKWQGGARWTFNACVDLTQTDSVPVDADDIALAELFRLEAGEHKWWPQQPGSRQAWYCALPPTSKQIHTEWLVKAKQLWRAQAECSGDDKRLEELEEQVRRTLVSSQQHQPTLFELVCNDDSPAVQANPWLLKVPRDIREKSVHDFIAARKEGMRRVKNGKIKFFQMHYRSSKAGVQSFYLRHRGFKNGVNWSKLWNKDLPLRLQDKTRKHPVLHRLDCDSRIVYKRPDKFFLAQSDYSKRHVDVSENQARHPVIALDPNNRTFQVGYDPLGNIIEFAPNAQKRIWDMGERMDKLQSIADSSSTLHRTRWHIRHRRLPRLRTQLRDLVKDVHCKTSSFLCKNYKVVLLPDFKTSFMVRRENADDGQRRRINNKTARTMMTWSHCLFKRRLIEKAEEYGTKVVIVNEAYTTRCCSICGVVGDRFSGERFLCAGCGARMARDHNSSKNILLRNCNGL
jgi:IS605 OrfB family transposase